MDAISACHSLSSDPIIPINFRVILKIMSELTFEKSRKVKIDRITQFLYFHKRGMLLTRHSKRDIKSLPGFKVMTNFVLHVGPNLYITIMRILYTRNPLVCALT